MPGPIRGLLKLTEQDVARAQGLMSSGLGAEAVRAKLIDGGMDPGIADHAIQVAVERRLSAEVYDMLAAGRSPHEAKAFLTGKGVSPFVADEVIQGHLDRLRPSGGAGNVVRRVIGVMFLLGGIAMLFNPAGGRFFGFIMILIGLSLLGW